MFDKQKYMREFRKKNRARLREYANAYYHRNPERAHAAVQRYRVSHREQTRLLERRKRARLLKERKKIIHAFMGGMCVECRITRKLETHHIDPATKNFDIGTHMAKRSMTALMKEVALCELRCHKCHAVAHKRLREAALS
jgi:hypothetical protein